MVVDSEADSAGVDLAEVAVDLEEEEVAVDSEEEVDRGAVAAEVSVQLGIAFNFGILL